MTLETLGVVVAFASVLLGLAVSALGVKYLDNRHEQQRIQDFVVQRSGMAAGGPGGLENREFSETLLQRTLWAWLNALIAFFSRFAPPNAVQETNRRLIIAGNPFNIRAPQYYGLRVLLLIVGMVVAATIYPIRPSPLYALLALMVLFVFLAAPSVWLGAMMRRRQGMIRQGLPDALDMLSVITAAGLSFDQAMLRLGQTFKTAVGMEFARVVAEIEVGVSRKQALRNMQERADIPELSSFVAIILQSEALGMSIADVLHSQAAQMRLYRQFRAKEIAQQLPAKMMVPLALFVFPALIAVILGPFFPVLLNILQ